MGRIFQIEPSFCILLAGLILLVPVNWILAAVAAALVHELCHWAAIKLVGGTVSAVSMGPGGAVMETGYLGAGEEFLCALAGPGGSLLLLLLAEQFPELALCGAVQGCFNLLPVYPLDGGRVIRCLVPSVFCRWIEFGTVLLLIILGFFACVKMKLGILPLIMAFMVSGKALARKISCKQGR